MIPIDRLAPQLPSYLNDLAAWTGLDSGSHNVAGVNRMGDLVAERLVGIGASIRRYPCAGWGDCVAGTLRGRGRARVLLSGHLDTVYPDGTAAARPLRIVDGRAIGPGACDMKGGLLVGLYALAALRKVGFDDFAEITFFCSSDEEVQSASSKQHYLPIAARADAALVLEAGWPVGVLPYGALTVARKGGGRFDLHVDGVEAHAGVEFERGASAILALARKIEALHALNGRWPGVTVNVGVVRGGLTYNTVAGYAYADVDVRVARLEDIAEVEATMRLIGERCDVPHTSSRMEGGIPKPPMAPNAWLIGLAHKAAAELGFPLGEFTSGGTSDASFIAMAGTPVLDGLGPVGAKDHSPEEYLLVDSVVPRTALLAQLIMTTARAMAEQP
jgi:glutamate carboxypeptidase